MACDWSDEIRCFDTFLHELAFFYIPSILPDQTDDDDDEGPGREASASLESDMKVQLKNVVWPAIKAYLEPSKGLLVRTTQVTSLPELYRVFERYVLPRAPTSIDVADGAGNSQVLIARRARMR